MTREITAYDLIVAEKAIRRLDKFLADERERARNEFVYLGNRPVEDERALSILRALVEAARGA